MFPQEITKFLHELSLNNNKVWFDANRLRYEKLKSDFFSLVQAVIFLMSEFEPEFAHLNPKDCIYRINRDLRFSKDKSPYKTYMSAAFSRMGRKTEDPAYYFHIDGGGILRVDGGLYNPDKTKLGIVREVIDGRPDKLLNIINTTEFKNTFGELIGERLKIVPRGFSADNKNIELLKLKGFVGQHETNVRKLSEKELPVYIAQTFKKLQPLNSFLEKALQSDTSTRI